MANHLTPEELSKELGIERQEVIRVCIEEGVPIYQGKIDKTLFQAQLQVLQTRELETLSAGPSGRAVRPISRERGRAWTSSLDPRAPGAS